MSAILEEQGSDFGRRALIWMINHPHHRANSPEWRAVISGIDRLRRL
jgi:hypothetical protein